MLLETLFLTFFPLPNTQLYSDRTARGGETTAQLMQESDGIRIHGQLKGIVGQQGGRVGFVGLRRSLVLKDEEELLIRVEGIEHLKARAVFTTTHGSLNGFAGDLTYQTLLEETEKKDVYLIRLRGLRPTLRGREIDAGLAHPFRNTEVRAFALELKLSEQTYDPEKGIAYNLKVFF